MFKIPSRLISASDIKTSIYNELIATKQYEVRSKVTKKVFQSFLDYLITKQAPKIRLENISEYNLLSEEFDCMQSIVQSFRRITSDTDIFIQLSKKEELEQQLSKKTNEIQNQIENHSQIIQFLFKNRGISTHSEFLEIKDELYKAVRGGKIQQIDFLTRQKVTQNDLIFILNEEEKTAGIYRYLSKNDIVFVPYSVTFQSEEFVVTRIHQNSFSKSETIKTIQFPENSEINVIEEGSFSLSSIENIKLPSNVSLIDKMAFSRCKKLKRIEFSYDSKLNTIEKDAFDSSAIEYLSIPSSVSDLKLGWCNNAHNLNHIEIILNKKNNNLINFDNKFILRKSDQKSDVFDVLVFVPRDIEKAVIPSFIKVIDQYAFANCDKLKIVEFQENSKLEIIEACSFSGSSIVSISIPSSVTRIGDSCFASCYNFKSIQFSEDSKLFSIGKYAFFLSNLESITVPRGVRQIEESTFMLCSNLLKVEFSENSELRSIDNYAFTSSSIVSLTIPSSLVDIKESCFNQAVTMTDVEITPSYQQNIIYYDNKFILKKSDPASDDFDTLLFARRDIEEATIPSFIKQIAPHAFNDCSKIKSIEFSSNSNLKLIGTYSFCLSSIEKIVIPSSVIKIDKFAFSDCNKLEIVEFEKQSRLKSIGEFAFCRSSIKSITFPSEIEKINNMTFCQCKKLKNIEFRDDSKVEVIDTDAFAHSSIESLTIPSSITDMKRGWCSYTSKLNNIKIIVKNGCENIKYFENKIIIGKSILNSQIFDVLLFANKNIEKITIPSFIKKISSHSFAQCRKLKTLEFPVDSKLEIIDKYSFNGCLFNAISFPPHIKKIDFASFKDCLQLSIVELFDNSEPCDVHISPIGLAKTNNLIIMIPVKKKIKFDFNY